MKGCRISCTTTSRSSCSAMPLDFRTLFSSWIALHLPGLCAFPSISRVRLLELFHLLGTCVREPAPIFINLFSGFIFTPGLLLSFAAVPLFHFHFSTTSAHILRGCCCFRPYLIGKRCASRLSLCFCCQLRCVFCRSDGYHCVMLPLVTHCK